MFRRKLAILILPLALLAFAVSPASRALPVHASAVNCGQSTSNYGWEQQINGNYHGIYTQNYFTVQLSVTCVFNGDGSYYAKFTLSTDDYGPAGDTLGDVHLRVWSSCIGFYHAYGTATTPTYTYTSHGNGNPPDWVYYPAGCGPQADDGYAFNSNSESPQPAEFWIPYVTTG